MEINKIKAGADVLAKDLNWLGQVIETRLALYLGRDTPYKGIYDIPAPKIKDDTALYARAVLHYEMGVNERIALLLAIAPHIRPQLLDGFFVKNATYDRGFSEFGGLRGHAHSGFLPTGETLMFLLAGNDLELRFELMGLFEKDHYFARHNLLHLQRVEHNEPPLAGLITLSKEYLGYFTSGIVNKPDFSGDFPAKLLTTRLEWDDLVLPDQTLTEIEEIRAWIEHGDFLLNDWNLAKKIKPGYRTLFHGPPGTGKTLTASLLGKSTGLDVYRIDLSMIVSKYIGETEKNLASVFDMAENKNWLLFFDEADALFGKRTQTKDSHDRYANQEISFLLQRIEDFPGVAILATNLKSNMDDAFSRRFQSFVFFPMPEPPDRLTLWQKAFDGLPLDPQVDFEKIANDHEMAGGAIINVLRYVAIWLKHKQHKAITQRMILDGIRKELGKEGKTP
ncbi:hypothetical protein BH09BAC1_BH09BAC1_18090 [soil metagenome]